MAHRPEPTIRGRAPAKDGRRGNSPEAIRNIRARVLTVLSLTAAIGGTPIVLAISLVELVSRRRVSKKIQQVMAQVGFVILIVLMVFILSVDIFNIVR